jgi:hypothetical protein
LTQAIHGRKDRIRRAPIIYLAIAVEKLNPWSNFWQERQKPWLPTSSDIFKRSLESLETFDKEASSTSHKLERLVLQEFVYLDMVERAKEDFLWIWMNQGLMIKSC